MLSNLSVSDVKLKQFVLIAKAGLAIGESKEKGKGMIESDMMKEFNRASQVLIGCLYSEQRTLALLQIRSSMETSIPDILYGESLRKSDCTL
jgi:hypothetical protein